MKEMDCVEVVVELEQYSKEGVHKGMQGWICHSECIQGYWLVNFPQSGEKNDIAEIDMKEEDLKLIPVMHAIVNEQIKAQFENSDHLSKALGDKPDNLSDYLI